MSRPSKTNIKRTVSRKDLKRVSLPPEAEAEGKYVMVGRRATAPAMKAVTSLPRPVDHESVEIPVVEGVDFRDLLLRIIQRTNPVAGPHFKECPFCGAWLHMGSDPKHKPDCIIVEARKALGQPKPESAFRPDSENKWREKEFDARWGFNGKGKK